MSSPFINTVHYFKKWAVFLSYWTVTGNIFDYLGPFKKNAVSKAILKGTHQPQTTFCERKNRSVRAAISSMKKCIVFGLYPYSSHNEIFLSVYI